MLWCQHYQFNSYSNVLIKQVNKIIVTYYIIFIETLN